MATSVLRLSVQLQALSCTKSTVWHCQCVGSLIAWPPTGSVLHLSALPAVGQRLLLFLPAADKASSICKRVPWVLTGGVRLQCSSCHLYSADSACLTSDAISSNTCLMCDDLAHSCAHHLQIPCAVSRYRGSSFSLPLQWSHACSC